MIKTIKITPKRLKTWKDVEFLKKLLCKFWINLHVWNFWAWKNGCFLK